MISPEQIEIENKVEKLWLEWWQNVTALLSISPQTSMQVCQCVGDCRSRAAIYLAIGSAATLFTRTASGEDSAQCLLLIVMWCLMLWEADSFFVESAKATNSDCFNTMKFKGEYYV
jgi:hypothetical protein